MIGHQIKTSNLFITHDKKEVLDLK